MVLLDIFLGVVRAVVFVYDVITYPVYFAVQEPWKEKAKQNLGQVSRKAHIIFIATKFDQCLFLGQMLERK